MSFKTDYRRVAGLGSARAGTRHWWMQRLSSIALLPLTVLFVYTFGSVLGDGHAAVVETYSKPLNSIAAILFLIAGFRHLQQGLQVVIEDYVPGKKAATTLLILNILLCWGFAATGVFAVARISFVFAA